MIHPHTQLCYIDDAIGFGVFATVPIPRGTIVWVRDPLDREMTPDELDTLHPGLLERASKYCYRNAHGHYILCWDHTRYVNHSFKPNCVATPYHFEIAVRDIAAGEQITNDYGTLNIIEPFEAFDEGHHRTVIYPDDLAKYHTEWDALLVAAFPDIGTVEQPLRFLVGDEIWKECLRIADGSESMRSILDCYHAPAERQQIP